MLSHFGHKRGDEEILRPVVRRDVFVAWAILAAALIVLALAS